MEMLLLAMLASGLVMRYGVIDLVSSVRGTTSPPAVARQRRMELAHERAMAKIAHRTGPTVGEAVAARIATRVGQPKAPKVRKDRGAFRTYLSGLWGDSWEHATTSRVRHHERKVVGDLPRQRAGRAVREAARRRLEAARAARQAVDVPEPAADAAEPATETMPPADETMPTADPDTATEARARGCCYYAGDGSTDDSCASPVTTLIRLEGDPWRMEVCDEHRDRWHTAHDPDETGRYAVPPVPTDTGPICPVCGQPGMDHPECVALTYGDDDDAALIGPPPGGSTTPGPPSAAPTPTIKGATMGEILNPETAKLDADTIGIEMTSLISQLDARLAELMSLGVTGAPITAYTTMIEGANIFAASASEASAAFAGHQEIYDVVHSDESFGNGQYAEIDR